MSVITYKLKIYFSFLEILNLRFFPSSFIVFRWLFLSLHRSFSFHYCRFVLPEYHILRFHKFPSSSFFKWSIGHNFFHIFLSTSSRIDAFSYFVFHYSFIGRIEPSEKFALYNVFKNTLNIYNYLILVFILTCSSLGTQLLV